MIELNVSKTPRVIAQGLEPHLDRMLQAFAFFQHHLTHLVGYIELEHLGH